MRVGRHPVKSSAQGTYRHGTWHVAPCFMRCGYEGQCCFSSVWKLLCHVLPMQDRTMYRQLLR